MGLHFDFMCDIHETFHNVSMGHRIVGEKEPVFMWNTEANSRVPLTGIVPQYTREFIKTAHSSQNDKKQTAECAAYDRK